MVTDPVGMISVEICITNKNTPYNTLRLDQPKKGTKIEYLFKLSYVKRLKSRN